MRAFLALLQAVALTWTPSPTPNATTNVVRDGTVIASGLTTASYTDSSVPVGNHTYYVTATAGGAVSGPSNTITIQIGPLTATMIGYGTSTISPTITRVTVNVSAVSGSAIPQGTLVWAIDGQPIYTDTLLPNGRDGRDIWSILLSSKVPVTITYSGSSTFAPSTTTLP
jgi:hypothetical protein